MPLSLSGPSRVSFDVRKIGDSNYSLSQMSEGKNQQMNVGPSCLFCVYSSIFAIIPVMLFAMAAKVLDDKTSIAVPLELALIPAGFLTAAVLFAVIKSNTPTKRYEKNWWRAVGSSFGYGAFGVYVVASVLGIVDGFFTEIFKIFDFLP